MAEAKTITCQLYSKADRDDCWLFKKIERKLAKENFPDYEFKEVRNAKLDDFLENLVKLEMKSTIH